MRARLQPGFAPEREEAVALFARVPASTAKKLSRAALEVGRPKQEVLAHLVDRYAGALGDELAFGQASAWGSPPDVLTPQQLAELLQVDVGTVLRLADAGEIPGKRLESSWRFSRGAVLDWLGSASARL